MDFLYEFIHLKIQLKKINFATNNFSDNNVIGVGGFGKVYKGEISHYKGRSMVAFKRLDRRFGQGDPEFWKEIMMFSRHTHENLVSLLGYCDENDEKILVYDLASRGSLDHYLSDVNLTWTLRLKICLAAARGLNYLHDPKGSHERVIHCDIKSSNILLDENWNAKLSDMGLSKIAPANQQYTSVLTDVVGTLGYCDPLYMETYVLTKESDVYSFGVVLFEVLCGKLCYEYSNILQFEAFVPMWKESYELKKLDEIIFQDLKQQMDVNSLEIFSNIAYQCLQIPREKRPSMARVVKELEFALGYQDIAESSVQQPMEPKMLLSKSIHINGERKTADSKDMGETGISMGNLTEIELKLAYLSEKLVNLEVLFMLLSSREDDFEELDADDVSVEFVEKWLAIDLLFSFLDSEVKDFECSMESIKVDLFDANQRLSSCKHLGESFSIVEENLHDSEDSLKALQEHLLEMKMELGKLQMTMLAFNHNEGFSEDFHVSDIKEKIRSRTQTREQQRHILRMLEKSLASELDLEKKLTESKKDKEDLKLKLQSIEQEAMIMEEAAEVIWGRFLEAENAAAILMGISTDLLAQHQLNLDGFIQREDVLRSKLDNCINLLNAKDSSIEKLNTKITQLVADNLEVSTLREKVKLLEEKIKESESNSNMKEVNASNESIQDRVREKESTIDSLKENVSNVGI